MNEAAHDARRGKESDAIGRGHLKEAALGGIRWIATARVVSEFVQLITVIALARLISPVQFGHAAIALIVQTLVVAITSVGWATPLVQRKTLRAEHIAAAQAVVLLIGVSLTGLTAGLAPIVVEPALGAETSQLVQLASLLFLISSIGVVSQALLQRKLQFRRLSIAEIASSISGALASVALAIGGLNGAAVVLGVIVADFTLYGMSFAFAPPPRPRWHWHEIREILAFGGPTSLSTVMRSGFRNIDYVILGVMAGPAAVGYYWRAFQLGVEYQRKISGILQRIALPIYSRAACLEDMRAVRNRIARTNATIIFPLLAILVVTVPTVIPWIFGPHWKPAVVPTQILALAGLCTAVLSGFEAVILAVGRPKALLAWDAASLLVYACVVYVAARYGVTALCIAVTVVFLAQLFAAHIFLLRPLAGIPVREALYDILPALVGSAVLIGAVIPILDMLRALQAGPLILTTASGVVGLSAYLLTLRLFFGGAWSDFQLLVNRLIYIDRVRQMATRLRHRARFARIASSG